MGAATRTLSYTISNAKRSSCPELEKSNRSAKHEDALTPGNRKTNDATYSVYSIPPSQQVTSLRLGGIFGTHERVADACAEGEYYRRMLRGRREGRFTACGKRSWYGPRYG